MEIFIEIIGWLGTFFVVLAYFLVSYKKIQPTSKGYQLLNLFGTLGIGINVWHYQAWPSFALQIVWGMIAIFALFSSVRAKKKLAKK